MSQRHFSVQAVSQFDMLSSRNRVFNFYTVVQLRLVGWYVVLVVGMLVGWLGCWLVGWYVVWVVGMLFGILVGWLVGMLFW